MGKKILKKKSYDQKCILHAYLHVKKYDFFNFDLNLHFTLGNSKSSMGILISERIGQKYLVKKKF